jgi:hypothetical protein
MAAAAERNLTGRNLPESQLSSESRSLLSGVRDALTHGAAADILGPEWTQVRALLTDLSWQRPHRVYS